MAIRYISTRGSAGEASWSAAEAVLTGIAPDGGLLVPEEIPQLTEEDVRRLCQSDYISRAALILNRFLPDFSENDLREMAAQAYDPELWGENPAPLSKLYNYHDSSWMLELWHGPSAAFKDFGLRLLPYLTKLAAERLGLNGRQAVLAATSGDTGSATLEGFADSDHTDVIVCYPKDGVAPLQQLQMTTTTAPNATVLALEGDFDQAQREVKGILSDPAIQQAAADSGLRFISANSINWGRLAAQIVYYWSAYCDLLNAEVITVRDRVNFVVPTGNFGDILACWYAGRSGLPVGKLVCASNSNNVLSDFLRTGTYDKRRELSKTLAPSMDILVSSNLERLLFELSNHNGGEIKALMRQLETEGYYQVSKDMKRSLQSEFVGGFTKDNGIESTILEVYDSTDYVVDPHTAVGFNVYSRYQRRSRDENKVVYVATASPLKFPRAVWAALRPEENVSSLSDTELLKLLSSESGYEIPPAVKDLEEREVTQEQVVARGELAAAVREKLGLI